MLLSRILRYNRVGSSYWTWLCQLWTPSLCLGYPGKCDNTSLYAIHVRFEDRWFKEIYQAQTGDYLFPDAPVQPTSTGQVTLSATRRRKAVQTADRSPVRLQLNLGDVADTPEAREGLSVASRKIADLERAIGLAPA